MQYFNKVKAAASKLSQQSAQLITSVKNSIATSTVSNTSTAADATAYSKEELQELFEQVLQCIDSLAESYDAMIPSFETDPKLNASTIGLDLKRIITILKFDSEKWLAIQRKVDHDHMEESDIPCLDYFIQSNMIQSLCNRAHLDIPRGVMPLVLKALTLLLKSVAYPLLPHQSIHKSIAKIISVASRYDAIVGIYNDRRKSILEQEQYVTYRKRVDITLTGLLRVLWRKILENPPILDYFVLSDRRSRFSLEGGMPGKFTPESSPSKPSSSPSEIRTQIDILSALIPLMFEAKLGIFAQESILIALNLQDARIDHFLAHNTKFVSILLQMLCESFREALTFLISMQKQVGASSSNNNLPAECNWLPSHFVSLGQFGSNNSMNPSPSTSSSASKRASITNGSVASKGNPLLSPDSRGSTSTAASNMKTPMRPQDAGSFSSPNPYAPTGASNLLGDEQWGPVERFVRVLMFLRAVYSTLLDCIQNAKTTSIAEDFGYGMTTSFEEKSILLQEISSQYKKLFLQSSLWTSLESSNEGYNTALYTLLRMMLTILSKCEECQQDSSEDFIAGEKLQKASALFEEEKQDDDIKHNFFTSYASPSKKHKPSSTVAPSSSSSSVNGVTKNTSLLTSTLRYLLFPVNPATGEVIVVESLAAANLQFSPFYWSLLDRMTSYSKPLSLASISLANDIVSYTPPLLTQELVILCRHSSNANNNGSVSSIDSKGGPADMKGLTLDDAIARMCKSIELERSQTIKGGNAQVLSVYIDLSIRNVMRQVFHPGDHIAITRRLYPQPSSSASSSSMKPESSGELYVDRIQRRLQSYFTLRIDEQVALSGVLQETSCLLATSMIVIPSNDHNKYLKEEEGKRILAMYMNLLKKVTMLRQEMSNYLKQVPEFERKLELIRDFMAQEAMTSLLASSSSNASTSATDSPTTFETPATKEGSKQTSVRKYLETESIQSKQILVGSIILQEIQNELQSYLFAVQFLRRSLLNKFEDDHFSMLSSEEDQHASSSSSNRQHHSDFDEQEEDRQDLLAMQTLVKSFESSASIATTPSSYASTNSSPMKPSQNKKVLELEVIEQDFNREFDQLQATLDQLATSG